MSNFDIYKAEWLDIVFEKRNKAYGAYDLRKHYAANMLKAFGMATVIVVGIFIASAFLNGPELPGPQTAVVNNTPLVALKIETQAASKHKVTGARHVFMYLNRKKGADRAVPVLQSLSQQGEKPKQSGEVLLAGPEPGKGNLKKGQTEFAEGNGEARPMDAAMMQQPPEPVGGKQSWNAYLSQMIVYPEAAHKAGIMGKVWLSFIVEKDGTLSDIEVEKPAGFGFDEEAVRVLKLAPAWKPGFQNGQAVRVKYSLPISFKITR